MRRRKVRLSFRLRRYLMFFVLVGPAVALRLWTAIYPVLQTIYLSFHEMNLMTNTQKFVGFRNFTRAVQDPTNHDIAGFTVLFIVASVALQLILGLLVALLLNAEFRGRNLVRTINLIPWAIPTIVAGLAFRWMLDDQYGLVTDWLFRLTGKHFEFLVQPGTARLWVILVNVWKNMPFMAVVLLAGLQSVPQELYEAARIDGATPFQGFRYITLPMSTGLLVTLGLFFFIWQLASFDLMLGMTHGGPGVATTVIAYTIFQNGMLWFNWGMASALGVFLIMLVGIIGIIGLALFRRYDISM